MARYQDFSSTAEAFPRWFARHGLREGGHPHKPHDWPKSTSLCCEQLKVSQVKLISRGAGFLSEPVIGCD